MVSPHVAIGRQNLAANTITLMRRIGMSAFQTVRVPSLTRDEVKALNHADTADPLLHRIDVAREIERALAVTAPVLTEAGYAVRFAGNLLEVMLNVRQWNRDLEGYVACASFNPVLPAGEETGARSVKVVVTARSRWAETRSRCAPRDRSARGRRRRSARTGPPRPPWNGPTKSRANRGQTTILQIRDRQSTNQQQLIVTAHRLGDTA